MQKNRISGWFLEMMGNKQNIQFYRSNLILPCGLLKKPYYSKSIPKKIKGYLTAEKETIYTKCVLQLTFTP